jgi:LmbE family N-acetylglucosaminyl deacetylase
VGVPRAAEQPPQLGRSEQRDDREDPCEDRLAAAQAGAGQHGAEHQGDQRLRAAGREATGRTSTAHSGSPSHASHDVVRLGGAASPYGDRRHHVTDEQAVERALVVVAHPDDVDFGAAGTVATWTDEGVVVTYCVVTDGDAGGFDPAVPRDQIGGIRQAEQRAAAKEVGVDDVRFLGYPDGRLDVTFDLRRDISRVIRQVRPQRVLLQSPERNWERIGASHPDHRATGEAALCAVYPDARNPFTHVELAGEGLEAWTVPEVWVMAGPSGSANRWVDVTDVFDRKVAALLRHESQTSHMDDLDGLLRGWLGRNAAEAGYAEGRLAEAFKVVDTR